MPRKILLASLPIAILCFVQSASPAPGRREAAGPLLAFGYTGKHPGLYLVGVDGGSPQRITHHLRPGYENSLFDPAWSHDRSRIAFVAMGRDDVEGIYSIHSDGTHQERLSDAVCVEAEADPDWSPGGRRIVFRHDGCENAAVWVMNRRGGKRHKITGHRLAFRGVWRPTGGWIAYEAHSDKHGQLQIFVIRPNRKDERQVTTTAGASPSYEIYWTGNDDPAWSPNGRWLVYEGGDEPEPTPTDEVCVTRFNGSHTRCLTDSPGDDSNPEFSPGGKRIVFISDRDGNDDIYRVRLDGTHERQLTSSPAKDAYPVWSPDGHRIAFVSQRSGHPDIYVMRSDGTGVRRVTHTQGAERAPVWAP